MKLSTKQVKKIIKEELNNILNESEDSYFEKLKMLMTAGEVSYNSAVGLFDSIKEQGILKPHEEVMLQAIGNYAGAFYEYNSISIEYKLLKDRNVRKTGTPEEKERFRELRKLKFDAYDRMVFTKPKIGFYEDEVHKRLVDSLLPNKGS